MTSTSRTRLQTGRRSTQNRTPGTPRRGCDLLSNTDPCTGTGTVAATTEYNRQESAHRHNDVTNKLKKMRSDGDFAMPSQAVTMMGQDHYDDCKGKSFDEASDGCHLPPVDIGAYSAIKNEALACMLKQLTREEIEIAARASYEYVKKIEGDPCAFIDDGSEQLRYASAMAQRYLDSKVEQDRALQFMKATIQFRKEMDMDRLRDAATDMTSEYHIPLVKFLSTKQSFVQGYDKQGRSTYQFIPRLVKDHDPEWTRKGHVWSLERAIACSKALDKTVNFVVDFKGFSVWSHAPPTSIGVDIMLTLRNHYVGHVHRILLVDAPEPFYWLWSFFKNFAGTKTRDKIQFVNSEEQKVSVIGELYCADEATSWMLPNGEKNRELDLEEYLNTPFDHAFDE